MKKLFVICPGMRDATSFWRGVGPLSHLKHSDWHVHFHHQDMSVDWDDVASADMVFLQRPFNKDHRMIAEIVVSLNRPLWVDFDDDLFCVPVSNPSHARYSGEELHKNITTIMNMATVISVSTEYLKTQHAKRTSTPIVVIPNSWNDYIHPWNKKPFKATSKIFWRGGPTHNEDIESVLDDLHEIIVKLPSWEWVFIGNPHYKIVDSIPKDKCLLVPPTGIVRYYNILKILDAQICIVPLADNDFNKSKSNIAWQEATYAGAAALAPRWAEWQYDGVIDYYVPHANFSERFFETLESQQKYYDKSFETIKERLLLSKVNNLRRDILNTYGA